MAHAILVEYLIEYHSSVLIELDRRGQQSERLPLLKCCFLLRNNQQLLHQKHSHELRLRSSVSGEFGRRSLRVFT